MAWSISNAMMKDYENSLCSLEQVGAVLAACCLESEQSAQSSTTPTPDQYYWPVKTTEHSRLSWFGMTCVPLTESHGADLLTWFLEVSLARISAPPAKELDSKESAADCGEKWRGSFVKYNHDSCEWKIAQCSLLGDSESFSETWPQWGSMHDGECWAAEILAPRTKDEECGFWHPTPTKSDFKGANFRGEKQRESQLKEWLHVRYSQGMKTTYPHPTFLERVMGWPEGWTELSPLATDKFQVWLQQHGGF